MINFLIDNNYIFYGLYASTAGFIGYKFVSSYINCFYVDKGIQTDAWEDYSERASQLASNSVTSIDTVTPKISPTEYINSTPTVQITSDIGIQTITDSASTATTVLPIPQVEVLMIPNQTILTKIVEDQDWLVSAASRSDALADMLLNFWI